MEEKELCVICGGKEMQLVDGFYYCSECGTQDVTVRETIVEGPETADGTLVGARRRLTKKKFRLEMSGEWNKWHAYNFILSGLADELVSHGANHSFKAKLLWIWVKYIKKYHVKEDYNQTNVTKSNTLLKDIDEDLEKSKIGNIDDSLDDENDNSVPKDIKSMTYTILYAMLYTALHLDDSDIYISQFLRHIKEGRLSYHNCTKYIPVEIDVRTIPHWQKFIASKKKVFGTKTLRKTCMLLFKNLELGSPLIPNFRNIINVHVRELCLPKEFKNLVFSLLEYKPVEDILITTLKLNTEIPDYETILMAYIMVALKMCFGLDDDYDVNVSEAVDKLNTSKNHSKAYRIGISEATERLFSFKDWVQYLQFRKILLCKYYQPMATKYKFDEDDVIIAELLKDGLKECKSKLVTDELTHDLLSKIPSNFQPSFIPKNIFPISATPLTAYTEFAVHHLKDFHKRLLLSEDFSKYSLKYACTELRLENEFNENIIKGISEDKKVINYSYKKQDKLSTRMVYIKYSDNKDWIKDIEQPDKENCESISYNESNSNSKNESDNEIKDDSDVLESINNNNEKLLLIEELEDDENIFDEKFEDTDEIENNETEDNPSQEYVFEFTNTQLNSFNETHDILNNSNTDIFPGIIVNNSKYDPLTFNPPDVIKALIITACRKYKIPIPSQYNDKQPQKRKLDMPQNRVPKQIRIEKTPGRKTIFTENIMNAYYSILNRNNQSPAPDIDHTHMEIKEKTDHVDDSLANNCDNVDNASLNLDIQDVTNLEDNTEMDVEDISSIHDATDINPESPDTDNKKKNKSEFTFEMDDDIDLDKIIAKEIDKFNEMGDEKVMGLHKLLKENKSKKCQLNTINTDICRDKMEDLIESSENVNEFKYFLRHYGRPLTHFRYVSTYLFENEMKENMPKSFKFMLQTCARTIEVSVGHLFTYFQTVEAHIMN